MLRLVHGSAGPTEPRVAAGCHWFEVCGLAHSMVYFPVLCALIYMVWAAFKEFCDKRDMQTVDDERGLITLPLSESSVVCRHRRLSPAHRLCSFVLPLQACSCHGLARPCAPSHALARLYSTA